MSSKTTHCGTLLGLPWPCLVRKEFRHNHVSVHTHTHTADEEIQASGSQRELPKRWTHTKWRENLEPSFLTSFEIINLVSFHSLRSLIGHQEVTRRRLLRSSVSPGVPQHCPDPANAWLRRMEGGGAVLSTS